MTAPDARAALVTQLATVSDVESVVERLLAELPALIAAELAKRADDPLLGPVELARLLGVTPKALSMRLSRPSGAELLALAVADPGSRSGRAWRKSAVDAYLARGAK